MTTQKVNIINLYTVVDRKKWSNGDDNVFVGRGSKWGNPFLLAEHKNREEVVRLFKEHLLYDKRFKQLKNSISELKGKVLGCWCAPSLCHAEVLHHLAGNCPVYETNNFTSSEMSGEQDSTKDLSSDEKLDLLLKKLEKLDNINETVSNIDRRLSQIELENETLKGGEMVWPTREKTRTVFSYNNYNNNAHRILNKQSFWYLLQIPKL